MATDWSTRTAAIPYFERLVKQLKRSNDEDVAMYEAALNALRRSQDHTAIQTKLGAAMKALTTLVFMARTAGGTAGRDEALCLACDDAERVIGQKVPPCARRKPEDAVPPLASGAV